MRFILALLVAANHLWLPVANKVGAHAVISFYIMSGYLMTLVLHEVYPASIQGRLRYLANRALRIYPVYWLIVCATLVGLTAFPGAFRQIYSLIFVPADAAGWFKNMTLWDLTYSPVILIPPAWSLWVEFVFYVAMGLVLAYSRLTIYLWVLASAAITIGLLVTDQNFADRYYPVYAASIFFSLGSLIFIHREALRTVTLEPVFLVGLIGIFIGWPLLVENWGYDRLFLGYYGAVPIFLLIFVCLLNLRPTGKWKKGDRFAGDLAYPIFLTHFFASGIVRLLPFNLVPLSLPFFLVSALVTVACSVLIVWYFEPAVNTVRNAIRPGDKPGEYVADNRM